MEKLEQEVLKLCIDTGAHCLGTDMICGNCWEILNLCARVRAEALEEAAKAVSGFDNGCGCCADKDAPSVIHALKTPGRKETA